MSVQTMHVVTSNAELPGALTTLASSEFVALDTEFMRESTYFPKLCLVQLATLEFCVIVDPLAVTDLALLWSFLAERTRLKVLHAARQDLEVLAIDTPRAPALGPIFDTQIAAALLGQSAQIGYGALVTEKLGHTLAKGHTRADWTRRPLSEEQLEYAADDVRYLAPLYVELRTALERSDRQQWLEEETRELEREDLNRTEPEQAWRRLKGLDRLRPEQRATAKLLAQWREELAIKHDKPRGWIITDEALRAISERLPNKIEELEEIRALPPGVVRRRAAEILDAVDRGVKGRERELGVVPTSRPEPEQLALVSKLMTLVRTEAHQLQISPEILATRRDLEQLVYAGTAKRLLSGWRRDVIGERLIQVVNSKRTAAPNPEHGSDQNR